MGQNHLVTVEGISACVQRLGDDGLLTVTRGIQDPPRDNLKLLATAIAALRRLGVAQPQQHTVMVRDFLALCTIVKTNGSTPGKETAH